METIIEEPNQQPPPVQQVLEHTSSSVSLPNLQLALAGLHNNGHHQNGNESTTQNSELLVGATQTVVSFVFANKQPSLFNLLIQMLTTNKFSPITLGRSGSFSNIPFRPSPNPSMQLSNSNNSNNSTQPQLQSQSSSPLLSSSSSSSSGGVITPRTSSSSIPPPPQSPRNTPDKSAQMFHILHEAINSVSQQYQTNFYLHILEKPTNENSNNNNNNNTTPEQDNLIAGCLSFINHMLSCAPTYFDFERYRQLLSAQGVNDQIKKYIKSVNPNVRSELLHYQNHKINGIKTAKHTPITDRQAINSLMNRFLKISLPNSEDDERWKVLGFDSSEPTDELLGTGILGLRNLIYFGARYSRIFQEILQAQLNKETEDSSYSFVRVGMSLTNVLYEIYIEDENLYEIIFDQDDWFEELFCISFELFDEIWEREGNSDEDYIPVLHKTRAILSRLKWTNPESIQSFQNTLGSVLDEMWSKTQDIKEEKEMNARVGGLSDSILGLPSIQGHSPSGVSHRFPKLFGVEKYKTVNSNRRQSTESYNSNTLASSNESNGTMASLEKSPNIRSQKSHVKKMFTPEDSNDQHQSTTTIELNKAQTIVFSERDGSPSSSSTNVVVEEKKSKKKSKINTSYNDLESTASSDYGDVEENGNGSGVGGTLKQSGSYIYKTVKKAMVTIEKKGKTISKKVKGKKGGIPNNFENDGDSGKVKDEKKKKKKSKKNKKPEYIAENDRITAVFTTQIELENNHHQNGNNNMEIPEPYKPSLDLDFDDNSSDDSSYYSSDDSGESTSVDNHSLADQISNTSFDKLENVLKPQQPQQTQPQPPQSQTTVVEKPSTQPTVVLVEMSPDKSVNSNNMIRSPSTESNLENPSNKPSQSTTVPPNLNRTISDQSLTLTDAVSLSVTMKKQQPTNQLKNPQLQSIVDASTSPNDSLRSRSSQGTTGKRSVLSRAPIPTVFTSQKPELPKSPSIKNLVNFFEEKSTLAPPQIQRQKSFRSSNQQNIWDKNWSDKIGVVPLIDCPSLESILIPKENIFYCALPYNDLDRFGRKETSKLIPWSSDSDPDDLSILKNRWIRVAHNDTNVFCQFEDVGPLIDDDFNYVFGPSHSLPECEAGGLAISPEVAEFLGILDQLKESQERRSSDIDGDFEDIRCSWQFYEESDVPDGPWKNLITTSPSDKLQLRFRQESDQDDTDSKIKVFENF
eukprot:gene11098-13574_t